MCVSGQIKVYEKAKLHVGITEQTQGMYWFIK